MKRSTGDKPLPKPDRSTGDDRSADDVRRADDARRTDALYGLEPVLEPGDAAGADSSSGSPGGTQFQTVQCPYCGERFETLLDLSAGSASYVEDCQVCCQPIQFSLEVDHTGALAALTTLRGD